MNKRLTMSSALMLALLLVPVAHVQITTNVQIEVNALLGFVGNSGCEFYRNGTWSGSKTAQAHLRNKYEYLVAKI